MQVLLVKNPRPDASLIRYPRAFVPRAVTALIGPSTVLGCWGLLGVAWRLRGLPMSRGRSSGRSRRPEHGLNRTSCCCTRGTPPSLGFCPQVDNQEQGKCLLGKREEAAACCLSLGEAGPERFERRPVSPVSPRGVQQPPSMHAIYCRRDVLGRYESVSVVAIMRRSKLPSR